jgi:hypothetical protein
MFTFFQRYFILHNIKKNPEYLNSLTSLPPNIACDEGFIISMLETNQIAHTKKNKKFDTLLNLVSEHLKDDTEFIKLVILKASTSNIQFATERARNDFGLMQLVIKRSPSCIKYMGEDLKNNIDFADYAMSCSRSGTELQYFHQDIKHNYDFILDILKNKPKIFSSLPKEFKQDSQLLSIMKEHCERLDEFFPYFHEEQKNDPAFNLELLKRNPLVIKHFNDKIKKIISNQEPIEALENYILREKLLSENKEIKIAKKIKI